MKRPQYSYNEKRKGNSILLQEDQIRPQGEYEEQKEEEISTIPSVNDLLEHLQNETSEDEIIYDQVDQFENSEDQIMQEDNPDYSLFRTDLDLPEKDKESKAIPKMKQSLEVQDLLGA